MPILNKGTDFATNDQVTSASLKGPYVVPISPLGVKSTAGSESIFSVVAVKVPLEELLSPD